MSGPGPALRLFRGEAGPRPGPAGLLEAACASLATSTVETYRRHARAFARWARAPDPEAALQDLVRSPAGRANAAALEYQAAELARGMAPKTVAARVSFLRSVARAARRLEVGPGIALDLPRVRHQVYRDTRGPGLEAVRSALRRLGVSSAPRDVRDCALISLLFALALRRNEAVTLDLADVELAADGSGGSVAILAKGQRQRWRRTLPPETAAALADWIRARGDGPGPLFTNLDRAGKGEGRRLTGNGVWRVTRRLGLGRPHGLRHTSITTALELTGGDIKAAMEHSRHRSPGTVMIYLDNLRDPSGRLAREVAAAARPG